MRLATLTIRSRPPAACIADAAATTAIIISMTSIGIPLGSKPKPKVRIARPRPPKTPRPIPPACAPSRIHASTMMNCMRNSPDIKCSKFVSNQPVQTTRTVHCLIRSWPVMRCAVSPETITNGFRPFCRKGGAVRTRPVSLPVYIHLERSGVCKRTSLSGGGVGQVLPPPKPFFGGRSRPPCGFTYTLSAQVYVNGRGNTKRR